MQFAKEGGQRSCPEARFYPTLLRASRDSRPRDPHYIRPFPPGARPEHSIATYIIKEHPGYRSNPLN
jgi:hypothetical protein